MDTRFEELSGGQLAWLYLRPHRVDWPTVRAVATDAGYQLTEERQSLVDDQVGACIRYLCMRSA